MAKVDVDFQDLLHPHKDLEKSFQIDISNLLRSYIAHFVKGEAPTNFNSAALLLQGSSSLYGKKVEYLHTLATHLYSSLVKHKKDEQVKKDTNKKDKVQKDRKCNDPFFSNEIKLGKNLSCLRKKTVIKIASAKKSTKKVVPKKPTFVPEDLLPFEGEDRGETFYDTQGEAIGNKFDYVLNKCKMTVLGWLLLPTLSSDLVPAQDSPADYTIHVDNNQKDHCEEENMGLPDCTPDEGIGLGSQTPSEAQASPDIPLSQQTDEGLGSITSTPQEPFSQPSSDETPSQPTSEPMEGVETAENADHVDDIPIDQIIDDIEIPATSLRRSMRQAQKLKADETLATNKESIPKEEEIVAVKKAIQKKNTCNLPTKLKLKDGASLKEKRNHIAKYCSETFFLLEPKISKNKFIVLETIALQHNAKFTKKLEHYEEMKAAGRKNKKTGGVDDENQVEDADMEVLKDPDSDDLMIHNNLDDDEIPIPEGDLAMENLPQTERLQNGSVDLSGSTLEAAEEEELMRKINSMKRFETNAETTRRVKELERKLEPFLEELDQREAFDINLYGSRILNSFDATVEGKQKRQTKTFKEFCKGMEKWQIHRYFMALLPLANIGNVELETEQNEGEDEEIMITLLSKRMHHLALEEFNNSGSSH